WPTACAHELALFRQLAGPDVEVERVSHIQAGDPVCAYVLRAAERDGQAQPPVHRGELEDLDRPGHPLGVPRTPPAGPPGR
ncbi:MAG TPA: hypothetical protein VG411_03130, partial [Actinomycetota bacterium]|nr:hypothetical protein [Actinomycetota bacterium]